MAIDNIDSMPESYNTSVVGTPELEFINIRDVSYLTREKKTTPLVSFSYVYKIPRDTSRDISYGEIQKHYRIKAKSRVDPRNR